METLILGQSYEPLARVGWRRAMTLWLSGRVEVLASYEHRPIRTPSRRFEMPAVARFHRSVHRRGDAVRLSREHLFLRDRGRCQYCHVIVAPAEATYDHVIPRSRGGDRRWDNLVLACRPCNQRKGDRTPSEARMRLRTAPSRPTYRAHLWRVAGRAEGGLPAPWRPWLGAEVAG